jgi:hypothetical protein
MLEQGIYKKTRHSGIDCVEVTLLPEGSVGVRHSKNDNPPHIYTQAEWVAFVKGVKEGEFDYPST